MSDRELEEWKEARSVLGRFDGYLADLRKYGFLFLAALLTVDSIQKLVELDPLVKFGLILITLAFIVTLHLLDHNYQQYLRAASIRAMILERTLNIELTETISDRYKREGMSNYTFSLYIGFVLIATVLGGVILPIGYLPLLILAFFLSIASIAIPFSTLYPTLKTHKSNEPEDWTIEKLSYNVGERVRITITNLDEEQHVDFKSGQMVCEIKDEEGNILSTLVAANDVSIPGNGNYSLFWDTGNLTITNDTIYRIWPREWGEPLRRSILVHKPQQSQAKSRT